MSNASIMLGFTRNAIKVFLVLCLLHTWTKATPILRTEARKDIHQKTEPLVAHNDEDNAWTMTANSKSMGYGITVHHLVKETTGAAASKALEKKKTTQTMHEDEKQFARLLVDHLDYAAARTHPPKEP
ncbi:hypothetical protein KP509_25G021600 [Ceratopteris richardii]|uniref:Uncharacterized protein n=1 Tax=Ceratopteris richardii TaxID=49495 RepID=A0A8T2RQA6_CERRI|nr:hypothetical protein KP509_25G021600 [Ceratopteris richardii]